MYSDQILMALVNDMKFNKLHYFTPYEWQASFMKASSVYKQRYLRAGNQVNGSRVTW